MTRGSAPGATVNSVSPRSAGAAETQAKSVVGGTGGTNGES